MQPGNTLIRDLSLPCFGMTKDEIEKLPPLDRSFVLAEWASNTDVYDEGINPQATMPAHTESVISNEF